MSFPRILYFKSFFLEWAKLILNNRISSSSLFTLNFCTRDMSKVLNSFWIFCLLFLFFLYSTINESYVALSPIGRPESSSTSCWEFCLWIYLILYFLIKNWSLIISFTLSYLFFIGTNLSKTDTLFL